MYDLSNLQVLCSQPCHADKTAIENEREERGDPGWDDLLNRVIAESDTMA